MKLPPITDKQKIVLELMRAYVRENNCAPTMGTLAKALNCSQTNIYHNIHALFKKGFLNKVGMQYTPKVLK